MTEHPLLALQRLDLEVRELEARQAGLAERQKIQTATAEIARISEVLGTLEARKGTLEEEIGRLDGLATELSRRIKTKEDKLYSGSVTAPRELEDLQAEIAMFSEQRADQEEAELEVMQQEEEVSSEILRSQSDHTAQETFQRESRESLARRETDLVGQLQTLAEGRSNLTSPVPEPFLRAYERLRSQKSLAGKAVTILDGRACGGCHIALPEMARTSLSKGEEVVQCEPCGRILVQGMPSA
jgi:predicted  nucleic acid-binding Zn-ribbon protein